MNQDRIELRLTRTQALVLSDWIDSLEKDSSFDMTIPIQFVLSSLQGQLETSLHELFSPEYEAILEKSKKDVMQ